MENREWFKDTNWEIWIKCYRCDNSKPAEEFNNNSLFFLWKDIYCRKCRSEIRKEYRWRYSKYQRKYQKKYRRKNKEKIKWLTESWQKNILSKEWWDPLKMHNAANNFIRKLGLRPELCPICWKKWKICFHHTDYSSDSHWATWVFCCNSCHKMIHSWEIECPKPIDLNDLQI